MMKICKIKAKNMKIFKMSKISKKSKNIKIKQNKCPLSVV